MFDSILRYFRMEPAFPAPTPRGSEMPRFEDLSALTDRAMGLATPEMSRWFGRLIAAVAEDTGCARDVAEIVSLFEAGDLASLTRAEGLVAEAERRVEGALYFSEEERDRLRAERMLLEGASWAARSTLTRLRGYGGTRGGYHRSASGFGYDEAWLAINRAVSAAMSATARRDLEFGAATRRFLGRPLSPVRP